MERYNICIVFILLAACVPVDNGSTMKQVGSQADMKIDSLIDLSEDLYAGSNEKQIYDKYIEEALSLSQKSRVFEKNFQINIIISKRFFRNAKYSDAIKYANNALNIANELNNDLLKAEAIQEIAVNFRKINDNSRALKLHTQALELAENVKDTFLIHCSYNGIGNVYFEYEDYPRAIEYFHKSLDYLGKTPINLLGKAINTNLLGESWLYMGNADSAMYYMILSYDTNVKLGSNLGKGICYNGFGLIYKKKKEYEKAIPAFKKAIDFFEPSSDTYYIAMGHYNLGETYLEMNQLKRAEFHLNMANELSNQIGNKSFAVEALVQLAFLYNELGISDKAFAISQEALAHKDSITKEMQQQEVEAMNVLYKSEKQGREIIILKQKNELTAHNYVRQKYISAIIVSIAVILALIGISIYRQNKLKNKLNEIGLRQRLLRSQMNPHFIFNSLGAIQNFMYKNENKKASFYLGSFSSLMRAILVHSREELISLTEEIKTLNNYMELQKMRLGFSFEVSCDDSIDDEFTLIPPMLIQPFVENAIKHGIAEMSGDGRITVAFSKSGDRLKVVIDDNGVGVNSAGNSSKDHKSLALEIFKERLLFLSYNSKKHVGYKIVDKSETNSKESGTIVIVELPLILD